MFILVWPTSWTPAVGGLIVFYAVLRARRTIAVTRPLVLQLLLLRDHAQAAGVWKTDAVNL